MNYFLFKPTNAISHLLVLTPFIINSTYCMQESEPVNKKAKTEFRVSSKFDEIIQACPNSVRFLKKILQKNELPENLIYAIIDQYLKLYLFKYPLLLSPYLIDKPKILCSSWDEMLKNFNISRLDNLEIKNYGINKFKITIIYKYSKWSYTSLGPYDFETRTIIDIHAKNKIDCNRILKNIMVICSIYLIILKTLNYF